MKSLGLRFLSWVFFHVTQDEAIRESIETRKQTFLDVLRILTPKYCRFEGAKNIQWQSLDKKTWNAVLKKAQVEQDQACICKYILSNCCRCPHRMADERNVPKNQTRNYVYDIVWKGLRDELNLKNAPATALRQKFMVMVLAAGSHAVIDRASNLSSSGPYQKLNRGDRNRGEWRNGNWSVFFKTRGAILLLQKDIMAFLLSPESTKSTFSISLLAEKPLSSITDPSYISELRAYFQYHAPMELQKSLETALQLLEIIGQPSEDAVQVLKEYEKYIRDIRTSNNRSMCPIGGPHSAEGRIHSSRPFAIDSDRRPSLRSSSRGRPPVNTLSSSKRHDDARSPTRPASPYEYRVPCSIGSGPSDDPYKLWL